MGYNNCTSQSEPMASSRLALQHSCRESKQDVGPNGCIATKMRGHMGICCCPARTLVLGRSLKGREPVDQQVQNLPEAEKRELQKCIIYLQILSHWVQKLHFRVHGPYSEQLWYTLK